MKPYLLTAPHYVQVAVIGADKGQAVAYATAKFRLEGKVVAQEITWQEYNRMAKETLNGTESSS